MIHVKRAVQVVGFRIPLNSNDVTEEHTVALYSAIKPLFRYKSLRVNFKRRFEGIMWKTVFNIISKHQGKFADEVNAMIARQQ